MELYIYNTLTKKKERFVPLRDKKVLYYTCGPTVYDYPHIGNFATYVRQDLFKRLLEYLGYEVIHVMNTTDIDDKTIKRSVELGWTLQQLTDFYTKEFLKDMEALNIKKPTKLVPATSEIPEMIKVIQGLVEKGYAYVSGGSVYFSIEKFPDYGKLSGISKEDLKPGARVDVDEYDKEHPGDFALWKESTPEELERGIFWETPWGKGRPGWHIECSVIALKHLGETIDVHSGGIDLIFPHHENEIAQSEAYTGKEFSRYWFHCEHVLVNGRKMSKSLGNFITVHELIEKGVNPIVIRLWMLSGHYRKHLNFTDESLKQAEENLRTLVHFLRTLKDIQTGEYNREVSEMLRKMKQEFLKALCDDMNTPKAFAVMYEFIHEVNRRMSTLGKRNAEEILETFFDLDRILGLRLEQYVNAKIPKETLELLEKREQLRKEKNFAEADRIREQIRSMGYEIEDTPKGPKVWPRI